jgi:integrase
MPNLATVVEALKAEAAQTTEAERSAMRQQHARALYRMLYETAGRSEEILGVNIEDLDFAGRRCRSRPKAPARRPAARPNPALPCMDGIRRPIGVLRMLC